MTRISVSDLYQFTQWLDAQGWTVVEQIGKMVNGASPDQINPNVLPIYHEFLRKCEALGCTDAEDRIEAFLPAASE